MSAAIGTAPNSTGSDAPGHLAALQGNLQNIIDQVCGHPLAHCPADDLARA